MPASSTADNVSTHSHPKVAAGAVALQSIERQVSTHSHPKVAAKAEAEAWAAKIVSTHSHPKVAAHPIPSRPRGGTSFNTQPPEGGCAESQRIGKPRRAVSTHSHPKVAAQILHPRGIVRLFQHTATRRWLPADLATTCPRLPVSTHSHPKVAAHP